MTDAAADTVEVTLTEFEIDMSDTLPAGPTVYWITNEGDVEHSFEVEGQGLEEALAGNLSPGAEDYLQVDLSPGTYEVYCPVADHAEQGMTMTLTVSAADAMP